MRDRWMPSANSGKHARGLVEAVDIYQTVCDIMGMPLPADTVPFEGTSLRPILEDPEQATVKSVALSTFPRCSHVGMPVYGARGSGGLDNTCLDVERTSFTWMGYSMRTDRYRYTEFVRWNGTSLSPIWTQLKARELCE
jgi:iduronate 2-sulfatase|eukprot:COSAG01_NODE_8583_length_2729_cov_1.599240_2_plen_139_part_00